MEDIGFYVARLMNLYVLITPLIAALYVLTGVGSLLIHKDKSAFFTKKRTTTVVIMLVVALGLWFFMNMISYLFAPAI